ncbi:MAG TPA: hypothetical protein VL133_09360 [Devosia sp.]|nr:hypothetical protein [Devosia sp.]
MSQTAILSSTLSPDFARARKLSRVMAVLFTIGFWLALAGAILILASPLDPIIERGGHGLVGHGNVGVGAAGITVSLEGLSVVQCIWVMLALEIAILPVVFLMHHARRIFGHFARGEIFVLPVIVNIRQAGLWLILSFFAPIVGKTALNALKLSHGQADGTAWPLVIGIVTFIAAHIMAEATRIAAENAEIV